MDSVDRYPRRDILEQPAVIKVHGHHIHVHLPAPIESIAAIDSLFVESELSESRLTGELAILIGLLSPRH